LRDGRNRTKIAELLADERGTVRRYVGRTQGAHRWQKAEKERPVRPRSGKIGNARSTLLREEEERLVGDE